MGNNSNLKVCPFCKKNAVFIGVHDDDGNYKGRPGCDYEQDAWSGLSYALHHEGWGDCILCTAGEETVMGGVLFDTAEEAADAWNEGAATDKQSVGEWKEKVVGLTWCEDDVDIVYECSCCATTSHGEAPYCPNCGAKMKGGAE